MKDAVLEGRCGVHQERVQQLFKMRIICLIIAGRLEQELVTTVLPVQRGFKAAGLDGSDRGGQAILQCKPEKTGEG